MILFFSSLLNYSIKAQEFFAWFTLAEGTKDQDLFKVGCDKIYQVYVPNDYDPNDDYHDLLLMLEGLKDKYIFTSLKVEYLNHVTNQTLTITPTFTTDLTSPSNFIITFAAIKKDHPSDQDFKLDKIILEADMEYGRPFVFPYRPATTFEILDLNRRLTINDPWVRVGGYTNDYAVGFRVTGNWSDIKNHPIKGSLLQLGYQGFHVDNELIIDEFEDTEFIGSENFLSYITGSPGYQIKIEDNRVNFINCQITGCSTMWKGIIQDQGTNLFLDQCSIEDAEVGVSVGSFSTLTAQFTNFKNNVFGIKAFNGTSLDLGSNVFSSNGTWKPIYQGQLILPRANIGEAGIYATNSLILDNGSEFNTFFNGIVADNTTFNIFGSKFKNMVHLNDFIEGNGILLNNFTESSKHAIINANCDFENCQTGIRADKQYTTAFKNKFRDVTYGISSNNTTSYQNFEDNNIQAYKYGIQINSPTGGIKKMYKNIIEIDDQDLVDDGCIYIQNPRTYTIIKEGNYTLWKGIFGVRVTPGTHSFVSYNTGTNLIDNVRSHSYLFHIDGNRSIMNCNSAIGITNKPEDHFGFHANMANPLMSCNLSTGGKRGFSVLENNMASIFRGNSIGGDYGLHVEDNALLSITSRLQNQGNCWTGSSIKDALNKNLNIFQVQASQFLVDQSQLACYLPDWEAQGPWFLNLPNFSQAYTCNICPSGGAGSGLIDPNDRICNVANDLIPFSDNSITYTSNQDERRWTDRYQVYSLLTTDNCTNLPTILQQFQSQMSNSEIGKLANIDIQLNGLAQDMNNNSTLDGLNAIVDTKLAQLNLLRSEEGYKITNTNVQQLISELNSTYSAINTIMEGIITDLSADLNLLLQENSNIVTSSTIATRYKFINDIQIRAMLDPNIVLTSAKELELNTIADLCPSEGSYATLKARGLLHSLGQDGVYNDANCYIPIQPLTRKLDEVGKVSLSPNPTQESCFISISNDASIRIIKLYDHLGKLIKKVDVIDQQIFHLDTQDLMSGIYLMELEDDSARLYTSKITIVK